MRNRNTTARNESFSDDQVLAVWRKGKIVAGADPAVKRKDVCGAWIERRNYGRKNTTGWEIDHIKPVAKGGPDSLDNLQPLQWENNRHKSDDYPDWYCAVSAG